MVVKSGGGGVSGDGPVVGQKGPANVIVGGPVRGRKSETVPVSNGVLCLLWHSEEVTFWRSLKRRVCVVLGLENGVRYFGIN